MNFVDAIRTCFKKYADFSGCATRPEFWWWILFTLIGALALESIGEQWSLAFAVATCIPGGAVTSRRLHDTDRSGWLQLLAIIPLIGWLLLIIWCAEAGKPNRYSQQNSAAA